MNLVEVREKLGELENEMLDKVIAFEQETGIQVGDVYIYRVSDEGKPGRLDKVLITGHVTSP